MSTIKPRAEDLPYEGEIFRAPRRLFEETIVLVHHFGGNKKSFSRHIAYLNEIGFDVVSFNLVLHDAKFPIQPFPLAKGCRLGLRYVWEEQIRALLDQLPGRKILFAFSMPAGAAFLAARHRDDVRAIVCDGGPFLEVEKCVYNLFQYAYPVPTRTLRSILTLISIPLLGAHWNREVPELLASFPAQFPVLSIRGRDDQIVPITAIERFFSYAPQLRLDRAALQAGHLDGFRRDAEAYRTQLRAFLERAATPLE